MLARGGLGRKGTQRARRKRRFEINYHLKNNGMAIYNVNDYGVFFSNIPLL